MKTAQEYVDSLAAMKHNVWMNGQKVERPWEHPQIEPGVNIVRLTYEWPQMEEYEEMMTATSHLTGKKINRFTHIHHSAQDLQYKCEMTRHYCREVGCIQRCMGIDALNALSVITHHCDDSFETKYYERLCNYIKYFQENDLVGNAAMTDVKGDRSLRPHEQADPDLYLHVVEKNDDGIVVRGAKAHNTLAPYAHEIIVLPTRDMREEDADYAVAFAIPADAPGITMICRGAAPAGKHEMASPVSSKYASVESLTVFDNVFVPWERVFMCGEWQFAGHLAETFATYHRHSYCGCKPAISDILMGAAALVAEYNGIQKASHVREKLVDFMITAEIVHGCGLAASLKGNETPSGTYLPDMVYANVGKFYAGTNLHHEIEVLQDIAGGLVVTMPSESDYRSEKIGGLLKKYLAGPEGVDVDDRVRCFRLIEDLTASKFAGLLMVAGVHGGGSPQAERLAIYRSYDLDGKIRIARKAAGIEQ
ncbi:MAG TPA: 4-hydroxyphenylacetate 3-hydroxylase family protein [Candidatus Brocadiia bacterium]|nr:4-hydroxyphenylacetate 3-hydroxylase family protein [Candidatus Brocadiia bacterium]